jgi:hypothetical protein
MRAATKLYKILLGDDNEAIEEIVEILIFG